MNKREAASRSELEEARKRADIILKVHSGQMNAVQAARELGVSRKTYYKWEKRGLQSLIEGLCKRNSGRPVLEVDEEMETLKKKVENLEKELRMSQTRLSIQAMLKTSSEKKG